MSIRPLTDHVTLVLVGLSTDMGASGKVTRARCADRA